MWTFKKIIQTQWEENRYTVIILLENKEANIIESERLYFYKPPTKGEIATLAEEIIKGKWLFEESVIVNDINEKRKRLNDAFDLIKETTGFDVTLKDKNGNIVNLKDKTGNDILHLQDREIIDETKYIPTKVVLSEKDLTVLYNKPVEIIDEIKPPVEIIPPVEIKPPVEIIIDRKN